MTTLNNSVPDVSLKVYGWSNEIGSHKQNNKIVKTITRNNKKKRNFKTNKKIYVSLWCTICTITIENAIVAFFEL